MTRIVICLIVSAAMAQTGKLSGTDQSGGMSVTVADVALNAAPPPSITVSATCKQITPTVAPNVLAATKWACMATSSALAPANGIVIMWKFMPMGGSTQPPPTITPNPITIPAGGTSTAFGLQF
jgi:hypothetical protein